MVEGFTESTHACAGRRHATVEAVALFSHSYVGCQVAGRANMGYDQRIVGVTNP